MIHVLTGPNTFKVQAALSLLKEKFVSRHGKDGVELYSGEELTPERLQTIIGGMSLFATHRFVVIKYLSDNKVAAEQFAAAVNAVPEETTIVIIEGQLDKRTAYYKALKKLKEFHDYQEPDERELLGWIQEMVKKEGATITPEATSSLLRAVGGDQARLSHEIAKLTLYQPEVTEEVVRELVEPNPQDNIFALLDATLSGRRTEAQELLGSLEQAHEDPFQVVNMLIWQVHILSVVATGQASMSEADIAKQAKINPFVVKKTKVLSSKMNAKKRAQLIDAVAALDMQLKTSAVNPWHLLHQVLLTVS